jgi:hypothetical protein
VKISIARVLLNPCMRASARTKELSSQGAGATPRIASVEDNYCILDGKARIRGEKNDGAGSRRKTNEAIELDDPGDFRSDSF